MNKLLPMANYQTDLRDFPWFLSEKKVNSIICLFVPFCLNGAWPKMFIVHGIGNFCETCFFRVLHFLKFQAQDLLTSLVCPDCIATHWIHRTTQSIFWCSHKTMTQIWYQLEWRRSFVGDHAMVKNKQRMTKVLFDVSPCLCPSVSMLLKLPLNKLETSAFWHLQGGILGHSDFPVSTHKMFLETDPCDQNCVKINPILKEFVTRRESQQCQNTWPFHWQFQGTVW